MYNWLNNLIDGHIDAKDNGGALLDCFYERVKLTFLRVINMPCGYGRRYTRTPTRASPSLHVRPPRMVGGLDR
jgi:hypothetical protein